MATNLSLGHNQNPQSKPEKGAWLHRTGDLASRRQSPIPLFFKQSQCVGGAESPLLYKTPTGRLITLFFPENVISQKLGIMKLQRPSFMIYSEKLWTAPVDAGMTILHFSVRSTLASALPTSVENRPPRGRTPAQLEDILGKTGYVVFRMDCAKVHEVPPSRLKLK